MRVTHLASSTALFLWATGVYAGPGPEACGIGTSSSGQTLKIAKDTSLRAAPSTSSPKLVNEKATALLKERQYLNVDNTTTVNEECTKGTWSRIRVIDPEWLSGSHVGWVPSNVLRGKKVDAAGKEVFTEADFVWDKLTRPHKAVIVAGVNKLHQENSRCKDIDTGTASVSPSKGTPSNPVFFVTCGKGSAVFNAFFSKSDLAGGKTLAAAENLPRARATELCEQHLRASANHPSTVKFAGASVMDHPNGRTTVTTTFRAKNSFNLELNHDARCLLNSSGVMEATVAEAKNR